MRAPVTLLRARKALYGALVSTTLLAGCSLHGETRQTWQEDCYDRLRVGDLECTQLWAVVMWRRLR